MSRNAVVNIEASTRSFAEAVDRVTEAFQGFAAAMGRVVWSKAPARERRAQRHVDAIKRDERYENTPTFDKLAAIAERRGKSARERARLLATALA